MKSFGVAKFRRLLFVSCAGFVATNLIDLTDAMIAGNLLGEKALAAMNLFWPIIDLQFFVCTAVSSGTAILHSRAVGDFDARRATNAFSNGLLLSVLVGLVMSVGLWSVRGPLVAFYGVTGETLGFLMDYWGIFIFELAIFPVYVYLNTMSTCDGDSIVCAFSFGMELCVNVVASYFLCREYGVVGCALGTIISTLSGLAVTLVHFLRKSNSLVFRWHFSVRESVAAFLADLPAASDSVFTAVVYVVMNKLLLVTFGEDALPVMTAIIVTDGFALFLYGVAPAAQPLVGVYRTEGNFGAVRRVMRAALGTSLILGALTGVVFWAFPELTVRLIGIETPEIVHQACASVRLVACTYPFVAMTALFAAYYLYIERPFLSIVLVALQSAILPLTFSVVGSMVCGQSGFWFGYAAATPLAVLLFFLVLKVFSRNKMVKPPWFLDKAHDVYAMTWTLSTAPLEICRVAEIVRGKLSAAGAPPKTVTTASLLVEDMLMEIRDRNGGKKVLAEVLLDIRPALTSDGRFDARLILRDDGVIGTMEAPAEIDTECAFRREILHKVIKNVGNFRSRVTTGFNRQEFVFGMG